MTELPPASGEQDAVIDFLSHPETYGLQGGGVERIETHCSIVFLAGDRAYKLKRAIRYASLDYTTRELRRAACETELLLNRRTAPGLYLGVRSISHDASGALAFDGLGAALDHIVVMRRFAQDDLFDHLAESGRLTPDLMRGLGEAVARLHATAERMPAFGGYDGIHRVIAENARELALVASTLDGVGVATLSSHAGTALDAIAALLDRRRTEGKVRRCHGDLRLANIYLDAGHPTLFDCIDFSDEIGCIDVLYDLAFVLMDLYLRDRGDLGNSVFNAYLDHALETEGLSALPLFLALRAATRSYALAGSARRRTDAGQAAQLLVLARQHIAASLRFLAPQCPLLILVGGEDNRARAELAAKLAALTPSAPGARVLRFTPGKAAWHEASGVLAAGCSVLIEGVFTENAVQNAALELASRLDIQLLAFWIGPMPAKLNRQTWRTLDTSNGALTAVESAGLLIIATGAQPSKSVMRRS